jgi:hypothetical protein
METAASLPSVATDFESSARLLDPAMPGDFQESGRYRITSESGGGRGRLPNRGWAQRILFPAAHARVGDVRKTHRVSVKSSDHFHLENRNESTMLMRGRVRASNEKEITHGRVSWQGCSGLSRLGPLASSIG